MSRSFDLGPVSAYALAVKYGYTGTEEEWVTEMESKRLEAVTAASDAESAAAAAEQSKSASSGSADSAAESALLAGSSASDASGSATLAESYTHGGTGTREGEDSDNAKYYMEKAKEMSAVDVATTEKAGIVKPDGDTITIDEDGTLHGANTYELPAATTEALGGVKPDGDTITVDKDGTIRGQSKVLEMVGATADENGKSGLVPTPAAGQQDYVLKGDGTYKPEKTETLVFSNISVAADSFVYDTTYADYPYKADISCVGVTSDCVPIINFGMDDAVGGKFAPICESGEDTVTFYASEVPAGSITIPSVVCVVKGGA